jgi:hypothetical protein
MTPASAGGAVFPGGSIEWRGARRPARVKTPAGRMTGNVLIRFLDGAPFAAPRPDSHERTLT